MSNCSIDNCERPIRATFLCAAHYNRANRKSKNKEPIGEYRKSNNISLMSEHVIWRGMKSRCFSKNVASYKHYGARGITVCDRWLLFENFLEDMGKRPSPKHSIDRIDVNGNYEPSNCRWASRVQQMLNRTNAAKHFNIHKDRNTNSYTVGIMRDRKYIYRKRFSTLAEAIIARDEVIKNTLQ